MCVGGLGALMWQWVDKVKEPAQQQTIGIRAGAIPRTGIPSNPTSGQKAILEARLLVRAVTVMARCHKFVTAMPPAQGALEPLRRPEGHPSGDS